MKTFIVKLEKTYEITENDVIDRLYETKEKHTKQNMIFAAEDLAQEQFANDISNIYDIYDFVSSKTKILK